MKIFIKHTTLVFLIIASVLFVSATFGDLAGYIFAFACAWGYPAFTDDIDLPS